MWKICKIKFKKIVRIGTVSRTLFRHIPKDIIGTITITIAIRRSKSIDIDVLVGRHVHVISPLKSLRAVSVSFTNFRAAITAIVPPLSPACPVPFWRWLQLYGRTLTNAMLQKWHIIWDCSHLAITRTVNFYSNGM